MAIKCQMNVGPSNKPRPCGIEKFVSVQTGIAICPECDVAGPLVWPNDFLEWTPDMPFPGDMEEEESN